MKILKDYAPKDYPVESEEPKQKWLGNDLLVLAAVAVIGLSLIYILGPDVRYG